VHTVQISSDYVEFVLLLLKPFDFYMIGVFDNRGGELLTMSDLLSF
jgi:hypothetical protein